MIIPATVTLPVSARFFLPIKSRISVAVVCMQQRQIVEGHLHVLPPTVAA